jgi:hypothetical protein
MTLQIHSDASYLSVKKGRSRAGDHLYLGANTKSTKPITNNGTILTISGIIKHVMSSAAKAEVAGLFIKAKEGEILCTTLDKMGYPQDATPIQTDNSTASRIANNTINQQSSRSTDMQFYWVRDQVKQGHFQVFGPRARQISAITSPSTIHPNTTKTSNQCTSTIPSPRQHSSRLKLPAFCKGVLIQLIQLLTQIRFN